MIFKIFYVSKLKIFISLLIVTGGLLGAEEKIIQDEKMSFQKCLEVIDVSAEKLSITPEIEDLGNQTRSAVFSLSDGQLKIICEGKNDRVLVITKSD